MTTKIPDIIIQPFDPFESYNTLSDEYISKIVSLANEALKANRMDAIKESKIFIPFVEQTPSLEDTPHIDLASEKKLVSDIPAAVTVMPDVVEKQAVKSKKKFKRIPKEFRAWIYAVCAILVIRGTGVLAPNRVEGVSMEPNYHSGNIVITSNLAKLDRYDVVTAKAPNGVQVIKRIIGMPGDTVDVKSGHIYINGKKSKESFVKDKNYTMETPDTSYLLQDGQYFLSGDNRLNSTDSRYYGPVTKKQIHGQIIVTIPVTFGADSEE